MSEFRQADGTCVYCTGVRHSGKCPLIKSIQYGIDPSTHQSYVQGVEFHGHAARPQEERLSHSYNPRYPNEEPLRKSPRS